MEPKQIIEAIKKEVPAVKSVYFVGNPCAKSNPFPIISIFIKSPHCVALLHYFTIPPRFRQYYL